MTTSTIASARAYNGGSSELNELMSFGHVVLSDGEGNVTDEGDGMPYANEVVYVNLTADGQSPDDNFEDVYAGWEALTGFTGQDRYSGAVMHSSEFIGGGLERHIRENAGYYVAVAVDGQYDGDVPEWETEDRPSVGWATLYQSRESVRLESIRKAIRAENISYGEIAELQSLVEHIPSDDVELLQWAGVPEDGEDEDEDEDDEQCYCTYCDYYSRVSWSGKRVPDSEVFIGTREQVIAHAAEHPIGSPEDMALPISERAPYEGEA